MRNPAHPRLNGLRERVNLVEGDILDVVSLGEALKDVTAIVHAAAMVSFYKPKHQEMRHVNQTGTANLVNLALELGVGRLIYLSSIGALGPADKQGLLHEDCKWVEGVPGSYYGYTKYLGELEVHRGVAEGLEAAILNPSLILGPGDWTQGSPSLVARVASGLKLYPPGMNGFVGVWDVAAAARLALEDSQLRKAERFVVSSENLYFKDVFARIARLAGTTPPRWAIPRRPAMVYGWLNEQAARLRGTHPLITLENTRSSGGIRKFSSARFQKHFGYIFEPIDRVLEKTVTAYKNGTEY